MYVALKSLKGCTVNLTVTFPDLKIQNYARKTVKEDYADEADFENFLVVKMWKKECRKRGTDKDCFIKDHVRMVGNYNSFRA